MPPQYGLYAALMPILLYAFFGTSPHLAIGPVAISAILILAGVSQLEAPFTDEYIQLVILAGLLIGLCQMALGMLKLGRFVNLLSYPVITGFTSAASIIVITSQLKDVLGLETPRYQYLYQTLWYTIQNVSDTHIITLIIAVVSFLIILLSRRLHRKIPASLIVVILGTLISYSFDLKNRGVDIIGFVPAGLPDFEIPELGWKNMISLIPTVILVTAIGIVESVGIAKAIENKNQSYEVNTNQELVALGLSKIGGSFFGALPSSGSFSRSALLHETRARTTVASIITVGFVVLSLLFLTPYLYYLPKVILAVIIIYAVKNLFEYRIAHQIYKLHRFDFYVMLITFLVTLFVSIEIGVAVGFVFSFTTLQSSKYFYSQAMGKILRQNYSDDLYCEEDNDEGQLCIMIEDNLYFGNVDFFKNLIKSRLNTKQKITEVTIVCGNSVDMDSSGIKALIEMIRLFKDREIAYQIVGQNHKLDSRLQKVEIRMNPERKGKK